MKINSCLNNKSYLLTSTTSLPFAHLLCFLLKTNEKLLLHNSTIAAAMNEQAEKFENFFRVLCVSIILWLSTSSRNYKTKLTQVKQKRLFLYCVCVLRSKNNLSKRSTYRNTNSKVNKQYSRKCLFIS